jgi:hypothetical protein
MYGHGGQRQQMAVVVDTLVVMIGLGAMVAAVILVDVVDMEAVTL